MNDVVIVAAKRTPIGDFQGSLKSLDPITMGTIVAKAALEQAQLDPSLVQELACGLIFKAGFKGNPARQIQIASGMPVSAYAYTIDQQCGSGMKCFETVFHSISVGSSDIGVVVGTETMSQAPYLLKNAREGYRMGDSKIVDTMLNDGLVCAMENYHMGITAENLAEEYNITRQEQDELALLSHQRAATARANGTFKEEIMPVVIKSKKGDTIISQDDHPKDDMSLEKLAALKPAFKKDGTVTAGNASSLNDGASALVLMSASKAEELGIKPLAKIKSTANFGVAPRVMGIGPAYAIPKAIALAGLAVDDIGYYEINEAFAAQFIAVNRELKLDMSKVNANGSGIGLGHPVGCTGARLITSLIYEMKRRNDKYGCASLCVGGGPALAIVIENI